MIDVASLKARINIADVLDGAGVQHRRSRCACPVHGGSNPMSFSFNADTFYCFACGCKGDVVTLVEQLHGTDFKGAVEIISNWSGITLTEAGTQAMPRQPRVKRVPIELIKLRNEFRFLDQLLVLFTLIMSAIFRMLERGRIGLSVFYALEQHLDWELQQIDGELAILNYQIKHFKEV